MERNGDQCICPTCGRSVAYDGDCDRVRHHCGKPIEAATLRPFDCLRLGEYAGSGTERADQKRGGCRSCKKMTALFECEIHGVCTPIGVAKDKSIQSCDNCSDRTRPTE